MTTTGLLIVLGGCSTLPGGVQPTGDFANIPYASWSDSEPGYRFYPGDALDVSAPSAPELARMRSIMS